MQILKISSIKANADLKVFERGENLYKNRAISKASIQENRLTGKCAGNEMPYYDITIELDDYGVRKAECSCPFNFPGYCKHVVALLLKYVNEPDSFVVRKSASELINSINKDELAALLTKLVQEKPDIYDWIELYSKSFESSSVVKNEAIVEVSRQTFRRIFNRIDSTSDDLSSVELSATKFLEIGDANSAVKKLLSAIEDEIQEYPESSYYDEGYDSEVENLGFLLTEALLSLETDEERENYEAEIDNLIDQADEYCIEGLTLPLYVANNGWAEVSGFFEDSTKDLVTAKLNVLERQNKDDEFLTLAKEKKVHFRYAAKIMELGKTDEAFEYAMNNFDSTTDALSFAKLLRELNFWDESVQIAEKGVTFEGNKQSLAEWLAPIEETLGNHEKALQAWQLVFAESPSLSLYQRLQIMSGKDWKSLQPNLMLVFKEKYYYRSELAQILLFDEKWDEAMKLGIKENFQYGDTTEIVADGLIEHRPKWVIEISKKNFDNLVKETQSKYYPHAVSWLQKAKLAYKTLGQEAEWKRYFAEIKELYKRRPSLQSEFGKLLRD